MNRYDWHTDSYIEDNVEVISEYKEYIKALRQCAKEHKKNITPTFQIRVSDLCEDTAKLLENDVVERSKIDKAIEEINYEINRDFWNSNFACGLQKALEILKRNIGE